MRHGMAARPIACYRRRRSVAARNPGRLAWPKQYSSVIHQMLLQAVHRLLDNPRLFRLQQKLCNNYLNVRDAFREHLATVDKDILDVGCAGATCAGQIIDMEQNRYVGVDIEARYIELAKKLHPRGHFLQQDARRLPFAAASFDIVMFNGVWHHMDDALVLACMDEVRRVLRPTGVVLVGEPVFRPDWPVSTFFLKRDRGKFIRTRDGYRNLFVGLDVVEENTFRFSMHEVCGFVARKRIDSP
jgi:SAM-dependent methyltransferase